MSELDDMLDRLKVVVADLPAALYVWSVTEFRLALMTNGSNAQFLSQIGFGIGIIPVEKNNDPSFFGLPVIADRTLPPGVVEFRKADGTVTKRFCGL